MAGIRLTGFAPQFSPDCQAMVLGSFPGVASLAAGEYYAHPRNQFWSILSQAFGQDLTNQPFGQRYRIIRAAGLGLWDVIDTCRRQGSLDQAIRDEQAAPLGSLRRAAPRLRVLLLNGRKAQSGARRALSVQDLQHYRLIDLPSTSPAHASMSRADKQAVWLDALRDALPDLLGTAS